MSGVDNRIVTMKFDNREFERGAQQTLGTLGKIKQSMNFGSVVGGTVRGLGTINSALSKIGLKTPFSPMIKAANTGLAGVGSVLDRLGMKNPFASATPGAAQLGSEANNAATGMSHLEGGVTAVSGKFLALTTIALTALSQITSKAVNAGLTFLKSFSIAPIQAGLEEYQTNLQAIQTVQANTDRPLPEINSALKQLNDYSDQTIYNFGEMAKNVGTFTAAGVDLETSVSAIKGIANMAALSGSNSQQAATAMYQLSQALASGKVGLMDWNSVVNAGMGGKKLQGALAQTAIAMGEIDAAQVKGTKSGEQLTIMGKSFRESIMAQPGQESWLSSEILQNSLAALDGRYSRAALSAETLKDGTLKYKNAAEVTAAVEKARNAAAKDGVKYTDEQFAALQKLSTSAFEAATKVKTLGQVFDIAKETIGSGWSASFQNIFGNLKEAQDLFTGMSEGLGDIIKANALARNNLLAAWKKGGGRDTVIDGLAMAWKGVKDVMQAVTLAFRDVFPAKTSQDLIEMSERFASLMQQLKPSGDTVMHIREIFRGLFSVLDIGKQVLIGVWEGLKTLFDTVGAGEGNFLEFAGGIGNAITSFDQFLKKSGIITTFFQGLGKILSVPLALLKGVGSIITGIFGGFDEGAAGAVGDAVGNVGKHLSGLEAVGQRIADFFGKLGDLFGNVGEVIGNALMGVGDMISNMFTAETFSGTLDVINTSLLGAIVLMIKSFFNKGVSVDLTGGLFDGIKESLGAATGAFENMQKSLKADILLKLAIAIGVMAASLLVLSSIDPKALTKALFAMGAGFGVLTGAMAVLMKTMGAAGLVQLYVVTSAMTKMAASMLLLSFALKILAGINFADMVRGLAGLAGMMFILQKAMLPLAAGSKGMAKASASLILMGIALNILAVALKIFATMSWEEMAKGLIMLAGTLGILSLALGIMPDMKAEGIGLVLLGVAMNLLAVSMKIFATMSWEEMAKGLIMLAGSLVIIGLAIRLMPKTMMLQAVALVAVAGAMVILAGALKIMGSMGWEAIAKGLVTLAGALIIIAVGLQAIGVVGTVGAVGLMLAAAALAVLAPVMLAFGAMDWMSILKGLTMLAGVFVILGVAGALLAPVVPVILGLGLALLLLGAGLALAGVGALAFATAFGVIVATGTAGVEILVDALEALVNIIPKMMLAFGKGLVNLVVGIASKGPAFTKAMAKIMSNLLDAVIKNTPKIGKAIDALLDLAEHIITKAFPRWIQLGADFIVKLLSGLAKNMPRISKAGTDLIISFMRAMGKQIPRIIDAGYKMIIDFLNGTAKAIRSNSEEMGRAGANIGMAIIEGVVKGLSGAGDAIKDKLIDLGKQAWEGVKGFFGMKSPSTLMRDTVGRPIALGMAQGIAAESGTVTREMVDLGRTAMSKLQTTMANIEDAIAIDPNMNPTITPVLDLGALTKEANKMSSILATAPIMAGVSYETAADISAMTQASADAGTGPGGPDDGGGGDTYVTLEQHNHSPKPIDSVETYRSGKTLISLAKEALK